MGNPASAPEKAAPAGPDQLAESILAGTASRLLRLAAARGALPLPRPDLFRLLVSLAADADEEVRDEARRGLEGWPGEEKMSIGSDVSAHPASLAWLLAWSGADTALLAALLSNSATPIDSLAAAARTFSGERLDTLLLNQTLLIDHPQLLDEIDANPSTTPLQRARAAEIRKHFLQPAAAPKPAAPEPGGPGTLPPPTPHPASPAPAEEAQRIEPPAPEETAPPPAHGEEGLHAEAVSQGVMARILKMNVAEKIALAQKGTREERTILIRDSNRSVQDAVLGSPKLADNEVEAIARLRSVNDDILRQIAGNRDWVKSYAIVLGLVTNPKTPLGISMHLLQRLTTRDLKLLLTDKNVPDALRRHARKTVEMRVNKPGSGPSR